MEVTICAICCDEITKETGIVIMACTHSFHFSCLGAWFSTQFINKQKESCPCCRHEAGEKESLPKRSGDALNHSFDDLLWSQGDQLEEDLQAQIIIQNMIGQLTQHSITGDIQNIQQILDLIQDENRMDHIHNNIDDEYYAE